MSKLIFIGAYKIPCQIISIDFLHNDNKLKQGSNCVFSQIRVTYLAFSAIYIYIYIYFGYFAKGHLSVPFSEKKKILKIKKKSSRYFIIFKKKKNLKSSIHALYIFFSFEYKKKVCILKFTIRKVLLFISNFNLTQKNLTFFVFMNHGIYIGK